MDRLVLQSISIELKSLKHIFNKQLLRELKQVCYCIPKFSFPNSFILIPIHIQHKNWLFISMENLFTLKHSGTLVLKEWTSWNFTSGVQKNSEKIARGIQDQLKATYKASLHYTKEFDNTLHFASLQ